MSDAAIAIISPHADFAQSVAEQVKTELKLACIIAPDFKGLEAVSLVVTTEDAPAELACPVIHVRSRPVRMLSLLADIAQSRQQQADDVALGLGYVLKVRPKQLARGQVSLDLTDKEVGIIQSLNAAGAEGLSKEQLLKKVWGIDSSLDTHTLETHIYRLRAKIRELARDETGEDGLISATPGGYAIVKL